MGYPEGWKRHYTSEVLYMKDEGITFSPDEVWLDWDISNFPNGRKYEYSGR